MRTTIIRLTVCFLCLFSLFWGCDSQTEEPPQKPKAIRKKIGAKPSNDASSQVGKADSSSSLEPSQAGKIDSSDLEQTEPAEKPALKIATAKPDSSLSEKNKVIRKKITFPRPKDIPQPGTPPDPTKQEEMAASSDMKSAMKGDAPDGKTSEEKPVSLEKTEPPVTPESVDGKPLGDKEKTASPSPEPEEPKKPVSDAEGMKKTEIARENKASQPEKPASDAEQKASSLPDMNQTAKNDKSDKKQSDKEVSEEKSVPDAGLKLAKAGSASKSATDSSPSTSTKEVEDDKPLKDKTDPVVSSPPKPDREKEIARKDEVSQPKTLPLPDMKQPAKKDEPNKKEPVADISPKPDEAQKPAKNDGDGISDKAMASLFGIGQKETKAEKKDELYDPKGKTDPFAPLFKEEKPVSKAELEEKAKAAAEAKKGKKKVKRKRRIPRGPLEKVDLSQLKLVGIVRAESGNRALVEEASGKGYIITTGTYIGIHAGRVSEISSNKVIVEEEDEDFSGEITIRKRELKLQKPFGEDYYEM